VQLHSADIGGNLECRGGSFKNPGKHALSADGVTVGGSVFLGNDFSAEGEVRLLGADIGGSLTCIGGNFKNTGKDALSADRAKVRGSVFLTNGFNAEGAVRLLGVDIGNNLECGGGSFKNPGDAMIADAATVKGSVFLTDGFNAKGVVRLLNAKVGSNLAIANAELSKGALDAEHASVNGALLFREVAADAIDLTDATVGTLDDDLESWPKGGTILDGFVYSRISPRSSRNVESRLGWLQRSGRFARQPYQQLANVLRLEGNEAGAREVLIGLENDPRRLAALPWYGRLWARVLCLTINYGFVPLRAFIWVAGFVLLGSILFGMGYQAGIVTPSNREAHEYFVETGYVPEGYEPFSAAVYSFDTFVPFINLGQREQWIPRPTSLLHFYRWVHILLGWFFTTMFVVGVTGLAQRR